MEFSPKELISTGDILSEVLLYSQETRYENVTKGFIVSQMNKCLKALSYDTLFNETHVYFDLPANRVIDIPVGVFNIKQVYLFNGDKCEIGKNTANVYWKRNYFSPTGKGSVSKNKGNNGNYGQDPFYSTYQPYHPYDRVGGSTNTPGTKISNTTYYYGESNGTMMFSENCSTYSKVMIKFNGIWQFDDEKPSIPSALQEVLVDWCTEAVLRVKSAMNPNQYRALHKDAEFRLGYKPETYVGSWYKAKTRLVTMGSKKKEDLGEYLSKLNS